MPDTLRGSTVLLALGLLLAGCGGGGGSARVSGLVGINTTDEAVDVVYLAPALDAETGEPGSGPGEQLLFTVGPGDRERVRLLPLEDQCTVAPVVARAADGREVDRLEPPVCVEQAYEWEIS